MSADDLRPVYVSPKTAAQLFDCSRDHIYDLCNSGEVVSSKSGSLVRIEYASLVEHFERNRRSA